MPIYLFVYGTLKRGFHNHGWLEENDCYYLGDAFTKDNYTLLQDHYNGLPYVVKESSNQIFGELYLVTEDLLKRLDVLEGHPIFYKRELIDVYVEIDKKPSNKKELIEQSAYLYFLVSTNYNNNQVRKIGSGFYE